MKKLSSWSDLILSATSRSGLIAVLFLALSLFTANFSSAKAETSQYFPQTNKTISGKFLDYWRTNGGLTVFGYPITNAQQEVDLETGKTYLTQWFERNRFELHPENTGTRYEVLLGLLGKDLRREALTVDPEFIMAEPLHDLAVTHQQMQYFEETGHNLRGRFLEYWQKCGALERFGYPISEEYRELDPTSDKVYLVQWFERARFEYHPENRPPSDVLLGLLGKQLKQPTANSELLWKLGQPYSSPGQFIGLAVDEQGNSYLADILNGHLFKYSSGGQLLNWWDSAATQASLPLDSGQRAAVFYGSGVALDSAGNVFVAFQDPQHPGFRKYDSTGHLLMQVGERGSGDGQFYIPSGIAVDKNGNIYVGESGLVEHEARVQKFDSQGRFLLAFGDTNEITGLAADSQGNIYVLDLAGVREGEHFVKKYDGNGKLLLSWGPRNESTPKPTLELAPFPDKNKNQKMFVTPSPVTNTLQPPIGLLNSQILAGNTVITAQETPEPKDGEFGYVDTFGNMGPVGLVVDASDNVYVTDTFNRRLQKFDSQGHFLAKYKMLLKDGSDSLLPYAVGVDGQGRIYVLESSNNLVRRLDANGNLQLEFGGNSNRFSSLSESQEFRSDGQGNFYVLWREGDNSFIRKYNRLGQLLYALPAHEGATPIYEDWFEFTVDRAGNLYLARLRSGKVQKYDSTGKLVFEINQKSASGKSFNGIDNLAADAQGNIFFRIFETSSSQKGLESNYLVKYNSEGKFLVKFAEKATMPGVFRTTIQLKPDDQGNIYVFVEETFSSDQKGGLPTTSTRISKYGPDGKVLFVIDLGNYQRNSTEQSLDLQVDHSGNLYLTQSIDDFRNNIHTYNLVKYDSWGKMLFKLDLGQYNTGVDSGCGFELNTADNFYALCKNGQNALLLRQINSEGGITASYQFSFGGFDGQIEAAKYFMVDPEGYLIVLDINNNLSQRVQKFRLR